MPDFSAFVARHGQAIEKFVNSPEAEAMVEEDPSHFIHTWGLHLKPALEKILGERLPEDLEQALYDDLRDWWKNGNFHVWAEDETNDFGMGKWELGDIDFWDIPFRNN